MLKKVIALILAICVFTCIAAGCGKKENMNTRPLAERLEGLPYTKYQAMTGEEQQAFMDSFESPKEFVEWYSQAKDLYMSILNGES